MYSVIVLIVLAMIVIAVTVWIATRVPKQSFVAAYKPAEYAVPDVDVFPSKLLWALECATYDVITHAAAMNKHNRDVFYGATVNIADAFEGLSGLIGRLSNLADGPSTVEEVCDAIRESATDDVNNITARLRRVLASEIESYVIVYASIPCGADMTIEQVQWSLQRMVKYYREGRITNLPTPI